MPAAREPAPPPAILLMGPTASGKTDVAVALRRYFPVDLISVDSSLVYRGMDIGTAKPDAELLRLHPHQLVDIRDPAETYSAAEFVRDSGQAMLKATAGGRIPLLVGGTMFYFNALTRGLSDLPEADVTTREGITRQAIAKGWPAMHRKLAAVDPLAASRIHGRDRQRIQRALEIYYLTGRSPSELMHGSPGGIRSHRLIRIVLAPHDRSLLHRRIAERFELMLTRGLIEEVEKLRFRPDLNEQSVSMRTVGYRQVWQYLDGRSSLSELRAAAVASTRQLAKRQLTWLRRTPGNVWIDSLSADVIGPLCRYLESQLMVVGRADR